MIEQIQEELSPFQQRGIESQAVLQTITDNPRLSFMLCTIQDGKISWTDHLVRTSQDFRARGFVNAMNELSQCVRLPDVTFLVFIGEAFCCPSDVPVLSYCKHRDWSPATVSIPNDEVLAGHEQLLQEVETGIARCAWSEKKPQAFWRGTGIGGWGFDFMPRMKLVQVGVQHPDLIDAKMTRLIQNQYIDTKKRNEIIRYLGKSIPVSEHLQYKYQLLPDGYVTSFSRAYWQFFSNCVVFKQQSPWSQWFYRALRPFEHYIPYEADASDLVEKVQWAIEHDDEVQQIARNAQAFAHNNLKYSDLMLYMYLLLLEYAKLQNI